ncbi:hypothetical protein CEXT_377731 [Caerostris extrusa]|uniref:Uncharacterized protein n=1 Tax=Caerostris extrusa TaxID=172846 RepID=A0AAV4S8Z8_CAEEX|nr:hypothetical protein CEXT_377731 [Caerostris extrusa]
MTPNHPTIYFPPFSCHQFQLTNHSNEEAITQKGPFFKTPTFLIHGFWKEEKNDGYSVEPPLILPSTRCKRPFAPSSVLMYSTRLSGVS